MPEIDFSNLPSVTNYTFYPLLFDNNPLEILIGGANSGKCFGKGTEIVMADGRLKKIEDIKKDDCVMGIDSKPRKVLGITKGYGKLYKIKFRGMDEFIANKEHILCLVDNKENYYEYSIEDYLKINYNKRSELRMYKSSIEMPEVETFDKPYDIGFMIGSNNTLGRDSTFFIPEEFLYNSKKVRSKVLAGILDAKTKPKRGIIDKRKDFYVKNKTLAEQILYLANSLGFITYYTIKNDVYRIKIKGNLKSLPCKKYKAHNAKSKCAFKIEECGEGEYYGCMVDGDNKMLLKNFVVTHNSYFVAQKIIYKAVTEKGHRFLIARKVKKDVRHSCYDLLKQTVRNFGMTDLFSFNDTETIIKCKVTDNDMLGVGLDDVTKLKSFFDPTDFWLEEADQATPDDVNQLRLRLRGNTTFTKQGILTLNPIWAGHWIKKTYFDEPKRGVTLHHSTYKDNRFLQEDVIRYMQSITDSYYKDVYVDGNWGVYGGVVFTDYIIEDFDYSLDSYENLFMGMDFGYNHASALILGGFRDGELYVIDELYGKGWTNLQFIMNAEEYYGDLGHSMIIKADSAEPDRIDEWNSRGWHVEGATKGMGSLRFGIDFLTRQRMHINKTKCQNTAKEIQIFHRKKIRDKDGNEEYTDDFVEVNDDCIAALRYGTEELWHEEVYSGFISNYSLSDLGL